MKFYSVIGNKNLNKEDYKYAQKIWKEFNCKTMKDYHNLYLKLDVLQLTDVFEEFRRIYLNNFKLDPCNYYTLPGLSWGAMLTFSKIELEPLSDPDMYIFIEPGIQGGYSAVHKQRSKANN